MPTFSDAEKAAMKERARPIEDAALRRIERVKAQQGNVFPTETVDN